MAYNNCKCCKKNVRGNMNTKPAQVKGNLKQHQKSAAKCKSAFLTQT